MVDYSLNTEIFKKRAFDKYGDLYDYSLVEYRKATEKVKIICKKHGVFEQTPQCHMRGGCKKCSFDKMGNSKRITLSKFIEVSNKKHDFKYDYSLVSIGSSSDVVDIICDQHGLFKQIANNHMRKSGCYKCNVSEIVDSESFKVKAKLTHGDTYDYSLVDFKGVKKEVDIVCGRHGVFRQIVNVHLRGSGCQECAKTTSFKRSSYIDSCARNDGFSKIYLIECFDSDELFYKIGITCRGVLNRFYGAIPYEYKILREVDGEAGLVWDCEKKLFSIFKQNSYVPRKKFAGSTECFLDIQVDIFDRYVSGVLNNVREFKD